MKFIKYSYIVIGLVITSCITSRTYQRLELLMPKSFMREKKNLTEVNEPNMHKPSSFFKNKMLLELLDSAFVKNSDLLIAMQNIAYAEKSLSMVKLNFLPDISAKISKTYGSADNKDLTVSASLDWEIDIWGKLRNERKEVLANYLKTQEFRKIVQTKLVSDIAKGYYNLLILDEQLKIANKSTELIDSTLSIMKIQYKVGDVNAMGIQQIEAQSLGNKILISQIKQSINNQESALNILCGNYAAKIKRKLEDSEEFYYTPKEGYPITLLSTRPDIIAAELSLQAANSRVGIQQASLYPSINISLSGGVNSLITSSWFSMPASLFGTAVGGLTQPIFNRKRLRTQYEQAIIEREKEVVKFRQSVLEAYMQVFNALKNKDEIEKQFTFAYKKERALKDNIKTIQILFNNGVVNYLDVISVQSSYLDARLQTVKLSMEKVIVNIELYHALGGGWQ